MKRYPPCRSGISGLFSLGCPAAILGTIRAIVVDSIKRVMGAWAIPHIPVKDSKVAPLGANHDASPAVVWIRRKITLQAPLAHLYPCNVLRDALHRPRTTVPRCGFGKGFTAQAPARLGIPLSQISARNRGHDAAVTLTKPLGRSWITPYGVFSGDYQEAEATADHVKLPGHRVTSGVSPRVLAHRWGTLLPSNFTTHAEIKILERP